MMLGEPENYVTKESFNKTELVISEENSVENHTDGSPWVAKHKFPIWWWCLIIVLGRLPI